MRPIKTPAIAVLSSLTLMACSVFGEVSVKIAPYELIAADGAFEVRHYERMVLVSTDMPDGMDGASGPFSKLFGYISGDNKKSEEIAMTAPVFLDQAGPNTKAMSFVLPADFSVATAPTPTNSAVTLTALNDYKVAAISFSGLLNQDNIAIHRQMLRNWIADKGLRITGAAKAAGYNPPFTLPFLRRNEIFIPVE